MTYITVQNGTVALKNTFAALREIFYLVVAVNKRHVNR